VRASGAVCVWYLWVENSMPVVAGGAADVIVLCIICMLVILAYMLYQLGDWAPTFWPIGNSIHDLFYGAGDTVSQWIGYLWDKAISGTGWLVEASLRDARNAGYGVTDAIVHVANVAWAYASGSMTYAFNQAVVVATHPDMANIYPAIANLYADVTDLYNRVGSIPVGTIFDPSLIYQQIGILQTALFLEDRPRITAVELFDRGVTASFGQIYPAIANLISQTTDLYKRVGSIPVGTVFDPTAILSRLLTLENDFTSFKGVALGRIAVLEGQVTHLEGWATTTAASLASIATLTGTLAGTEAKDFAKDAAGIAALTAIVALTVTEIANLQMLAANPCACFMPGGELAFLIPLTMANTWNSM
jgi:hypothetical protein